MVDVLIIGCRLRGVAAEEEEQEDGGLVLSLRVAGVEEVRRWLLGYGAEVEVLEPESLRAELAEEAEKLRRMYGGRRQGEGGKVIGRVEWMGGKIIPGE